LDPAGGAYKAPLHVIALWQGGGERKGKGKRRGAERDKKIGMSG